MPNQFGEYTVIEIAADYMHSLVQAENLGFLNAADGVERKDNPFLDSKVTCGMPLVNAWFWGYDTFMEKAKSALAAMERHEKQ
jgi:hypothetical protein